MIEPTDETLGQGGREDDATGDASSSTRPASDDRSGLMGRLFGSRRVSESGTGEPARADAPESEPTEPSAARDDTAVSPSFVEPTRPGAPSARDQQADLELRQGVNTGFQDLSRLLGAIKETLSSRDGQVQQTLAALPDFLQQVPRIHRAEIECLAQISKQLEHMGTGTRDVLARFEGLPDLLRSLMLAQTEQSRFLDNLQGSLAEALETQGQALQQSLETTRRSTETQLEMIRGIATTQEDIFATFQNTQNRALNVFHRAQQQAIQQNKDTQTVTNRQIEMLVERVHVAQGRVFWLSIGFAALAAAGLIAVLFFS